FLFFYFFFLKIASASLIFSSFPTRRSSDLAVVGAGVRPVVLADDHDVVRACHPAQLGVGVMIGKLELSQDGGLVHLAMITIQEPDRKSTRLNSSHDQISYAVFCLKKKKTQA